MAEMSTIGKLAFGFLCVGLANFLMAAAAWDLAPADLKSELERLRIPVSKTAGPRETEAFRLVENYIDEAIGDLV